MARIYLVERTKARPVGEIELKADWMVTIDRQPSGWP